MKSQKYHIPDRQSIDKGSETQDFRDHFVESNKVTFDFAQKVEIYLLNFYWIAIIVIVNCMTLSLDLSKNSMRNSICLVTNKGGGKSTLLIRILALNNLDFFTILPKKVFESLLLEKGSEYFNNKIIVHDDLIIAFTGLNEKQLSQLLGFFTSLLSDKSYSRQDREVKADCLCMFGVALEHMQKFRKVMDLATFTDRVPFVLKSYSDEEKRKTLKYNKQEIPAIKLPLTQTKTKILLKLTPEMEVDIEDICMQLDSFGIMSWKRAQSHIHNFLMANALLNKRKETNIHDLTLFKKVLPFYLDSIGMSHVMLLNKAIAENPEKKDTELMKILGWTKATFYRTKSKLKGLRYGEST